MSQWILNDDGVLVHHGRDGQKWGIKNGPPYPLDSATVSDSYGSHSKKYESNKNASPRVTRSERVSKAFTPSVKQGKDKESISPAEKAIKKTKEGVESSKKMVEQIGELRGDSKRVRAYEEASKMSDQELRNVINRINLEKQYVDLTSSNLTKGERYASTTLSLAGDILAVSLSAAGLIVAIKQIKG